MTAEPRDGRVLHTGDTASPEPGPVDADPDQDAGAPLPLWQAYGRQQARQRRRRIAALGLLLLSQLGLAGYIVRAMQPAPPVPALPRTAAAPAADTLPMTAIDAPLVAEADPQPPPPPPQDTPDAAGTGPTDGMDDTDADVPDAAPPAPPARLRLRIQPDGGRLISHADTPVLPPRPAAPIDPRLAPARQASADGDWARARSGWAALLAADPVQADHAYNLAVALDQRGERQEAIRHYRMALALADSRPARFPRAPTLRRLATLEEER